MGDQQKRGTAPGLRWLISLLFFCEPVLSSALGQPVPLSELVATNMAQLIALPSARAAEMNPARVTGVITYTVRGSRSVFLQDGDHGLYAELSALTESIGVGWSVELTGTTREGSYQNSLVDCSMRILSRGAPPKPLNPTAAQLAAGSLAARYVEIQGQVRSATLDGQRISLLLYTEGYQFRAYISGVAQSYRSKAPLVDSEVRLKAVVTMPRVRPGSPPRPVLEAASVDEMEVLEQGMDPFSRPVSSLGSLMQLHALAGKPPLHALHVAGRLVAINSPKAQIEDETGRVSVECAFLPAARVGERVEAVGYLSPTESPDTTLVVGQLRVIAPRLMGPGEGAPRFPEQFRPVMDKVESIRELGEAEAVSGYPVRIVGVVTFVDPSRNFVFVQDSTAGIFISPAAKRVTPRLFDLVEVEGFTDQGNYAPIVSEAKILTIGQGAAPQTRLRPISELVSGHDDSQWVAVEAVVREMSRQEDKYELVLASGGQTFGGWIPYEDGEPPLDPLVDASVLVSAVCGTALDDQQQSLGVNLFIPSIKAIQVLKPPPNRDDVPLGKVAKLRQFDLSSAPGHRLRIAGRVLLHRKSGELLVHDGTGGIRAEVLDTKHWAVGDPVEVFGFLSESSGQFVLQDSSVLAATDSFAISPLPAPRVVTEQEWRSSEGGHLESLLQGSLIRTDAILLGHHRVGEDMIFTFDIGGRLVTGLMEGDMPGSRAVQDRSRLQLTGVADLSGAERRLRLLLRGPDDVTVLEGPPWWSQRWAVALLATLALAMASAAGAALSFRRQVSLKDRDLAKNAEHRAILERRFEELVENANDMIFTCDMEGRLLTLNRAGANLTGYAPAEIGCLMVDDLTADPQSPVYVAWRAAWMRGEGATHNEWVIRRKDGATRTLDVATTPQVHGGMAVGFQGIGRDIGERLKLEEDLRHAQKMETIGQLAGGVAHDFNNILTIIHGYNRLARMRASNDPELIESLTEVERAADRAATLTRQLLTFGRKQSMLRRVTNLNDLILQTSKMLHRLIGEAIELRLYCAPDLPLVWVDHGMMEQVLMNLVVNARDAMPEGGRLEIRTERFERLTMPQGESIGQHASGPLVSIEVRDSGTGMSEEVRARVFEPFFTTKPVGQGTGLGLATVYGIVKQHGGWVELETEVGRGSVFRLLLPVTEREGEDVVVPTVPAISVRGSETILLVEDEPSLRALCERVLTRCGYRVLSAPDGVHALDMARSHVGELDLLLTDLVMPGGISGIELGRRLSLERPGLRVLYSSGYGRDEARDSALVEGVNFMGKPYQVAELIHAVRRSLDCVDPLPVAKS